MSAAPRPPYGERAALWAMMGGNIAIGTGVIGPAGMMNTLSESFGLPVSTVGHLITFGSIVLFLGAPLSAWLTNKIGRRALLTGSLALYVVGHAASALVPDFQSLLIVRVLMIVSAAIYTPQAASAVSAMVARERQPAAIAFVFLGWSLASAAGVPLASYLATAIGWRAVFGGMAVLFAAFMLAVWLTVPSRLFVAPLSGEAWGRVFRTSTIFLIVSVTALQLSGLFALYPYFAPELKRTAEADPAGISLVLALFGIAGAIGNIIAVRVVARLGPPVCVSAAAVLVVVGLALWPVLSASVIGAGIGALLLGAGFTSGNSMQQARLASFSPELSSVSIAFNTSAIYLGQGIGTALGGGLLDMGQASLMAPAGCAFGIAALTMSIFVAARRKA